MVQLTLSQVRELADKMLSDGFQSGSYNRNWSRHIDVNYYAIKRGWHYDTYKNKITIVTSKLYNVAPYQRNKAQKTFKVDDPLALQKIKSWLSKQY